MNESNLNTHASRQGIAFQVERVFDMLRLYTFSLIQHLSTFEEPVFIRNVCEGMLPAAGGQKCRQGRAFRFFVRSDAERLGFIMTIL